MHNAVWSVGQQVMRQGLAAAFMLVAANHLTPFDLGLVGVATIWSSMLGIFLDLGFGTALVQRKTVGPEHVASVFALNMGAGLVLFILSLVLAGPVAAVMHAPQAKPLIRTMAIGFLFTSAAAVHNSLAQRELRFRDLAIRDFWASTVSAALGIALVLQGTGVWAIVFATLLQGAVSMVLMWHLAPYRIRLHAASASHLAELWSYGAPIFLYTMFKFLLQNADSLLIGAFFGPARLGIYSFAQRLTFTPIRGVQSGVTAFLFPRASQSQDDPAALARIYVRCVKALAYVLVPYAIALATIGAAFVTPIFGAHWADAVPMVRMMALAVIVFPIMSPLGEMMKATAHPQWLLRWGVGFTLVTIGALTVGSHWGFSTAIAAYVVSHFLTLPIIFWLVQKTLGLTVREMVRSLSFPYAALAALGCAASLALLGPQRVFVTAMAFCFFAVLVYRGDKDARAIPAMLFRGFRIPSLVSFGGFRR